MKSLLTPLAVTIWALFSAVVQAGGRFDNPPALFPGSMISVMSHFEKAKIEKTWRGFYLRADTQPGMASETEPTETGIYLDVAVRDAEEIPEFKDSSAVAGEITRRIVEIPAAKREGDEVALRIVFTFGSGANAEALAASRKEIDGIVRGAEGKKTER
jgi:hypothetical protein